MPQASEDPQARNLALRDRRGRSQQPDIVAQRLKGKDMPKLVHENSEYHFSNYATIGRSSKCTVTIKDIKLSRIHCEIMEHEGDFIVIDLRSQNGTKVNGNLILESFLKDGDKITLGRADVVFKG